MDDVQVTDEQIADAGNALREAFYEAIWAATDMTDADKARWLYEAAKHHDGQRRWWENHARRQAKVNEGLRARIVILNTALSNLVRAMDSDDMEARTDLRALEGALEEAKGVLSDNRAAES